MTTIPEMLGYPDGTPIVKAQAKVSAVYERKTHNGQTGPTTIQTAMLVDMAGNKIRLEAWGHGDLSMYKDKDIVLESKNGKGLKVKRGSYVNKSGVTVQTCDLAISRAGTIQPIEVYTAHNPGAAVSTPTQAQIPLNGQQSVANGPSVVHGAKVGMAINNAIILMTEQGMPYSKQNLYGLALEIIEVSNDLEAGKPLAKPVAKPAPQAAPPAAPAAANAQSVGDDSDVPF